jgi:hypothetical protein
MLFNPSPNGAVHMTWMKWILKAWNWMVAAHRAAEPSPVGLGDGYGCMRPRDG